MASNTGSGVLAAQDMHLADANVAAPDQLPGAAVNPRVKPEGILSAF